MKKSSAKICLLRAFHYAAHCVDREFSHRRLINGAEKGYLNEITALVQNGVPVDYPDEYFAGTALHAATKADQTEAIQLLLELGADREARDFKGHRPLFYFRSDRALDLLGSYYPEEELRLTPASTPDPK